MKNFSILIFLLVFFYPKLLLAKDMDFKVYTPCDGQGSVCSEYILADGLITDNTPTAFVEFVENSRSSADIVYFNSNGGNLSAGIKLGKLIRKYKLNTFIGSAEHVNFKYPATEKLSSKRYLTIIEKSNCYSACSYAFLGGVVRNIEWNTSSYGVHQFYSPDNKGKEDDAQITTSIISLYLDEMGVDRKLLNIASLTNKEDMHLLTAKAALSLNIINKDEKYTKWNISASSIGKLSICSMTKPYNTDAKTVLCFQKSDKNNYLIANIFYYPSEYYSETKKENLNRMNSEINLCPYFIFDKSSYFSNDSFSSNICSKWSFDGDFYNQSFLVHKSFKDAVLKNNKFELETSFSNANKYIDPSSTFLTDELYGAVSALVN